MKFLQPAVRSAAVMTVFLCTQLLAQDVDIDSPKGKAGYSMGVNIGMNIANQLPSEDLDMNALVMGITDAINGDLKMSEQDIMQTLQAFSQEQQAKAQAKQEEDAKAGQDFLAENGKRPEVTTTASGLQYEVVSRGDAGAPMPSSTDTVTVHYHGTLIDGTVFDSSVERGQPATLQLDRVIPGWTEGVQLMHVGDKFRFFIPSELAYGASGAGNLIGPNATLIFDIELLGIE